MNHLIITLIVLILSIVVQASSAIMAFRLIAVTGRHLAWIFISAALALMAVRRVLPLFHLITGDLSLPPDLLSETIGLVLSLMMAMGVSLIAPLFVEFKLAEDKIKNLAFYDSLTRLPNRRLLDERLKQAIATSRRSERYGALIFLDLDNFKPLNDMHGHNVGDSLLIEVANRLKNCVREIDTVARFGGDEFVVILSELNADKSESILQAQVIAEKIRTSLSLPYYLNLFDEGQPDSEVEHHCSASIGISMFIYHDGDSKDFMKWADQAMYEAKAAGRNSVNLYDQKTG